VEKAVPIDHVGGLIRGVVDRRLGCGVADPMPPRRKIHAEDLIRTRTPSATSTKSRLSRVRSLSFQNSSSVE
jgi:hypothetical protein